MTAHNRSPLDICIDSDATPPTSRLAHHLVAIYSDANGTVIGLDADVSTYAAAVTGAASSQDSGSDTGRQAAGANLTIFGRRDRRS